MLKITSNWSGIFGILALRDFPVENNQKTFFYNFHESCEKHDFSMLFFISKLDLSRESYKK